MFELVECETHAALGAGAAKVAAEAIRRAHAEGRRAEVLLASAPSQLPVLSALVDLDVHAQPVRYLNMDEYVGLDPQAPQAFGQWLVENYFSQLPSDAQAEFVRLPSQGDPRKIIEGYSAELPSRSFDLVLCGIGVNGHLAFNDPGTDLNDMAPLREVLLAEASRAQQVQDGLFETLDDVPQRAITMTVPRILDAHVIVCSVLGESKAQALRGMVKRGVTNDLPATVLTKHPGAVVFADLPALALVE